MDGLMTFADSRGSFRHDRQGSGNGRIATEQGFRGLITALYAEAGNPFPVYGFWDSPSEPVSSDAASQGQDPGKDQVKVPAVKLKSVKAKGKKALTVRWKKTSSVTGYQIRYSASRKFTGGKTKTKTVKGYKKTKTVLRGLKKGRTWYVQIRGYKKAGGETYYGAWSRAKARKLK